MGQVLYQSQESLYIIKHPGMSPFTDVLHFVSICVYSSVIYYMTDAFQSLWIKINFTLTKKEMVVSYPLAYNSKVFFVFFDRMQIYEYIV